MCFHLANQWFDGWHVVKNSMPSTRALKNNVFVFFGTRGRAAALPQLR